jgi:hypothetical protein
MDEVSALRTWLRERPNDWGSDFLFVSQKRPVQSQHRQLGIPDDADQCSGACRSPVP